MDTMQAFAKGELNRGKPLKVFDWDKAAQLIKEKQPKAAAAGLSGDWDYTGGIIYSDGSIIEDEYTYLASTWATPELEIDDEIIDCWKYQDETPNWDSETKWPESARKVLETNNK